MLLTPEEAKLQACFKAEGFNASFQAENTRARCIASACQAWRWGAAERQEMRIPAGAPVDEMQGRWWKVDGAWWFRVRTESDGFDTEIHLLSRVPPLAQPRGFCGLAGEP